MTRMAPLLRWRKRGNVSAPSPPTFYYRRGTFEKGEHGGELGVEMRSEALGVVERRGRVDEAPEAGEQAATDRGQTVVGQLPVVAAVAQGEPGVQDGFHLTGPGAVGMVVAKILATPKQVGHAGLVQCVIEAPIGCPSVAHEHPVEVGPEDGDSIVEPAAGADGVDGCVRSANTHSQWRTAPTRHPVSSGVTTGASRICSHSAV